MSQSESIANLAKALSAAQSQIKGALKDSQNPFFKSHYADLASVVDAIREPFAKNGLSYTQPSRAIQIGEAWTWVVATRIMHISGEWIEGVYPIITVKPNDPQAFGSANTYARRYSLSSVAGVAQVDDDAESATVRHPHPAPLSARPQTSQPQRPQPAKLQPQTSQPQMSQPQAKPQNNQYGDIPF